MTKNELKQKIEEKTKELEELKKIYKEETKDINQRYLPSFCSVYHVATTYDDIGTYYWHNQSADKSYYKNYNILPYLCQRKKSRFYKLFII